MHGNKIKLQNRESRSIWCWNKEVQNVKGKKIASDKCLSHYKTTDWK